MMFGNGNKSAAEILAVTQKVKNTANDLKSIIELSNLLEELGSIDQARSEVEQRLVGKREEEDALDKAIEEKSAVLSGMSAEIEAVKSETKRLSTEASREYNSRTEAAQVEADRIVSEANKERDRIIGEARQAVGRINTEIDSKVSQARQKSAELEAINEQLAGAREELAEARKTIERAREFANSIK